jgi:phage terminase large subunit-like protein
MTQRLAVLPDRPPRLWQFPQRAVASAGDDAVEWAESIGFDPVVGHGFYQLDEWQKFCIRGILSEDANARLCAVVCLLLLPRQNGKNVVLEVVELYGLFVLDLRLILHSAHLAETSAEHMQRLWDAIESDDDLSRRARRVVANGKERIYRTDIHCSIRFRTRSKKVGRGGSPQMAVFDEALYLNDQQVSALLPSLSAQSARPDKPMLIYASSAPVSESAVLRRVRSAVLAGNMPDAFMAEWSVALPDGDIVDALAVVVADRAGWATANPAMPARIDPEWIAATELATMTAEAFAIERLGVVFDDDDASSSELPEWGDRVVPGSKLVGVPSVAVDVAADGSWTSVCVAGAGSDGPLHVELVERLSGTASAVAVVAAVCRTHSVPVHLDPRSAAGGLIADLKAAGVEVVEVGTMDLVKACAALKRLVADGGVVHLGQGPLDAAVSAAGIRAVSDGWLWARRRSSGDISPLVAVTVALHGASVPASVAAGWFDPWGDDG